MKFLKPFIIFFFIFIFISLLSGKILAIEDFTPDYKITIDEWGNIKFQAKLNKTTKIFQTGRHNFSFHLNNDITSFKSIVQSGQFNYSYVEQSGAFNQAQVRQEGSNNTAVISQSTEKKDTKEEDKGEEE